MTTFPDTSGMTTEQLSKVICEWFDDPLNKASYAAVQRTVEKLTNYHAPHGFMLEDFNLLCGMVSDELHKDRAEVRRDALLEAADIVDQYEKEWVGKSHGSMRECAANIAARLRYKARTGNWFPDQGQSQGQGKE